MPDNNSDNNNNNDNNNDRTVDRNGRCIEIILEF